MPAELLDWLLLLLVWSGLGLVFDRISRLRTLPTRADRRRPSKVIQNAACLRGWKPPALNYMGSLIDG